MIAALLLAVVTSQALPSGRFERFCSRSATGRTSRGLPCDDLAFFEAFPASGSGAGAACACTNPTGARGETSATVRANSLDCRKNGFTALSGIVPGDIVTCGSNQPRVEFGADGVLGVEAWANFTQTLVRSDELDNAIWTSTEAVTPNQATAPDNTLTADQLNDTNGAVQSCTSQVFVTTSATKHVVWAYVRAGTINQAQLKLVGAVSSAGDCTATSTTLSGSTWNVLWCISPAAYAGTLTSVTVSLCVGDAVGDTGTVMGWRINHQVNAPDLAFPPPSLQAVAASASTAFERITFTLPLAMSATTGSHAASFVPAWASTATSSPAIGSGMQLLYYDGSARAIYAPAPNAGRFRQFDGANDVERILTAFTAGSTVRPFSAYTGAVTTVGDQGGSTTGAFDGTFGTGALTALSVGGQISTAQASCGIVSRVCADPNPLRCR